MSISITKKEDGAHESEIDELCKAEDKYFRDFLKALFRVDQRYIMWVHEGKVYKHVERVFAYELYHQFRKIMEIEENKLRYEEVFLNGETFKEGSLHGKLSKCFSSCYPDLVLHKDLMDNNTEGQYLLCEMKTSENPYIINDLKKLNKLGKSELNFKYYIFLLINNDLEYIEKRIKTRIKREPDIIDSINNDKTLCICLSSRELVYCKLKEIIKKLNLL